MAASGPDRQCGWTGPGAVLGGGITPAHAAAVTATAGPQAAGRLVVGSYLIGIVMVVVPTRGVRPTSAGPPLAPRDRVPARRQTRSHRPADMGVAAPGDTSVQVNVVQAIA